MNEKETHSIGERLVLAASVVQRPAHIVPGECSLVCVTVILGIDLLYYPLSTRRCSDVE